MAPLISEHKTRHPSGTHRRRIDNRAAMNAIFFLLRTGCQWNALNATGICPSGSAYRRFQEWRDAWVAERFRQNGLLACEQPDAIDWPWLSMDGCMTKSPLSGSEKQAATPRTAGNRGKAQPDDGYERTATRSGCRRILTRREQKAENYEAMLHFSCGVIVWNKIQLNRL